MSLEIGQGEGKGNICTNVEDSLIFGGFAGDVFL
jgi:hypothetical protein